MNMKNKLGLIIAVVIVTVLVVGASVFGIFFRNNQYDDYVETKSGQLQSGNDSFQSNTLSNIESGMASGLSSNSQKPVHNIKITGDVPQKEFDTELYSKRAYELIYQFGVSKFNDINSISVSAAVQYAFLHMYNDSLVDMNSNKNMIYRQCKESVLKKEVAKYFDLKNIDLKKSDLYSKQKGIFEMWEQKLKANVYCDSAVKKMSGGKYQIDITFYEDKDKKMLKDRASVVFKKSGNSFILDSLKKNQ
ncbi:MAG: hypothetical protein K0R90_1470 [Oscillospiraceae bacterium]|jgi:hypothetical protein|nr:hypothetical protein [Oscillospiraceae bacterium]